MKKIVKKTILAATLGLALIGGGTAIALSQTDVYAAEVKEETKPLTIDYSKNVLTYNVIKGQYQDDDNKTFDMYYSDGYFAKAAKIYDPHMATLAAQLANASCTYKVNGNYKEGDKHIKEALKTIGFDRFYTNDGYLNKPTTDSVGCIIAGKKLEKAANMNYDYVIDITVRSAGYEAEWASNVTLGEEGEAKGFADQATKITQIYLDNFLLENKDIAKVIKDGKVAFYVNGFSRGGAIANITAKRLVDMYKDFGNEVYAYCIEAPQGGVKDKINPDHDYKGIHNIINPNDLVCYVAPTEMGFMRYGVDHYIYGDMKDEIGEKGYFFETPCDNYYDMKAYDNHKKEVVNELQKMLGTTDVGDKKPYEVTWKKFDLRHLEISNVNGEKLPVNLIQKFMHNLMYRNGKMVVDRKLYATKMQEAVRNMVTFIFKDTDIKNIKKNITEVIPIYNAFKDALGTFLLGAKVSAPDTNNAFTLAWRFATGDRSLIYTLDFNESQRKEIAAIVKKAIAGQPKICKILDENYPTKAKGAFDDMTTLIKICLRGGNNINDYITFGENIEGILHNHKTNQAIAYLRVADDFYKDIA